MYYIQKQDNGYVFKIDDDLFFFNSIQALEKFIELNDHFMEDFDYMMTVHHFMHFQRGGTQDEWHEIAPFW